MRENIQDIYKILVSSETLLRLLYYLPQNASDSPLDPLKSNILDEETLDKWDIIESLIIPTEKSDDLLTEQKCTLFLYPGKRNSTGNYLAAKQTVFFEWYVPYNSQVLDLRMEWIADTINDLVFDKSITGLTKIKHESGGRVQAPKGYVGYLLIYSFGSGQ